ncbi:MAG TPA: hypothetical protein DCG34_10330 [Clostridiales bacterium]|nr:hypothetical protein [Clostridiales bacterium]
MKQISIVINGEQKVAENRDYTFKEIIILAFGSYDDSKHSYTVTMTKKNDEGEKHSESYSFGDTIKLKEGVRLNIDSTNRS